MNGLAEHIWCASSTNLVQGFLAGLGVLGGGLALFPLETIVSRTSTVRASSYARARLSRDRARVLVWLLLPVAAATVGGYLFLYAAVDGKSCDKAKFTPREEDLVVWWSAGVAVSFALLVALFVLRTRVRREQAGDED